MAATGHGPLIIVLFLCLAACTQLLLALYGLLSRYAQVKASPPVPSLRLVVVVNLLAEAALLTFHAAPLVLRAQARRWRQRHRAHAKAHSHGHEDAKGSVAAAGPAFKQAEVCIGGSEQGSQSSSPRAPRPSADIERAAGGSAASKQTQQETQIAAEPEPELESQPQAKVRAPVPLLRGLTRRVQRWEQQRPLLHRRLATAAITLLFTGVCSLQILAPGYVDVSIVMLTTQWTTLCIALAQAVLLRHRLPLAFWPCAAVMLGGAAMVIVPSVGQSTTGSLNTTRGWTGFAMAVGALLCTVAYYILLQACRHMGFSALRLQHYMNTTSILIYLPLTLPIDGASWGAQFADWSATDWVVLVGLSTVAYMGSGTLMQVCVWKLGAPTASMFFGLRLVFSVVLSTPILGSTIIKTGVQIAGVVITASGVTAYAASQWWLAKRIAGRVACLHRVHPVAQWRLQAPQRKRLQRISAQASSSRGFSPSSKDGITLHVNHAELLGLQGVQLPTQPVVEKAYAALMNTPLEEGYSELARLGKERLLEGARSRLSEVQGRTALLSPNVQVEPLLLPGAMALLQQIKRYDLVIELSEDGAGLGARQIRNSSRDTLRDIEQDMALATALAQCGMADRALKEGKPALACTRLQEALQLLVDAPHGAAPSSSGGPTASSQQQQQQGRLLAPKLQAQIQDALAEYHPDAVADYLQIPLQRSDYQLRLRELSALRQWAAAPDASQRRGSRPVLSPEYMARVVPRLTAAELCSLYDWQRLAASGKSSRCAWYFPGLLTRAALAHLVAGFVERQPLLVQTALQLFDTVKKDEDVVMPLAMCRLLLGDAAGALSVLEDAERQKPPGGLPAAAAGSSGGGGLGSEPVAAHAVMQFVRTLSPQGEQDLRPGLAAFACWWLTGVAYPEFQDTALGAAASPPDLAGYFSDQKVVAFLASQDGVPTQAPASLWSRLGASLGGNGAGSASNSSTAASERQRPNGGLPRMALQLLGGAALLAAALLAAYRVRSGEWGRVAGLMQPPPVAVQLPPVSAEATATDIGVPAGALRRVLPGELAEQQQQQQQEAVSQQQRRQGGLPQQEPAQQDQQPEAEVLSTSSAAKIVKNWLSVKAEAMGPKHNLARLSQVLEEPMLSAVASEASEAAASGWHWTIRPQSCKIASVDCRNFAGGSGHVTVLATVDETAQLVGADGKRGEGYQTAYQVEYTLVRSGGTWKISSALVLS
ncbi:hypothetical protein D9Q98_005422 [Chlorella vulgaris]|uniref:ACCUMULATION AND REPLICATION OF CHLOROPLASTS chloroplastic n=1 Tax=Chlorella vulgaris TaxID=3077 RepID=A0A9D4TLY3_CHLVU|nr:hypothetical protein D9Q98_005422 [Chlorella vulgaris]